MATKAVSYRIPQYLATYLDQLSDKTGKDRTKLIIEIIEFYRAHNEQGDVEKQQMMDSMAALGNALKTTYARTQALLANHEERLSKLEAEREKVLTNSK